MISRCSPSCCAPIRSLDGDELLPLIAKRRKQLLKRMRKRGRRVYAEKPKDFARRLRRYVELV